MVITLLVLKYKSFNLYIYQRGLQDEIPTPWWKYAYKRVKIHIKRVHIHIKRVQILTKRIKNLIKRSKILIKRIKILIKVGKYKIFREDSY